MDGNPNSRMAAKNGTYTVNDTSAVTGKEFSSFYVSSDAVIADLEANGAAADVRATYISTAGGTVSAGTVITASGDNYFSGITLTSGEVTLILR